MASEWTEVSLSELTTKITKGTTPTKKDGGFSNEGVNYIKSEAVTFDGRIDESKFTFISSEIHKKLKRSQLEESDILMSMAGIHLGKTAIVRTRHLPANTNQALALIRPIKNKIYPDYLFYFLQQPSVVYFINNSTSQSAQPNINLQEIGSLNIQYPEYDEQKAIAHILGSLDDKIELNRQMNDTLEAMAQALFKSWFVDFDPVIDNALAAGKPIPDEFIERSDQRKAIKKKDNSDIQDLFPDEFEFTEEMGWIPKGWGVIPIYEIADFINGSSFKSKFFSDENDGLPIIKIAEIKNGISQQTKFTTQEMADKYFISDGSIVFSWSGNPDTSIDTFIWTGGDGWLNQHIFNVVLHEDKDKTFIYYLLKSLKPVFTEIARDKQTTGLGHVTVKDMKRTYTIEPSSSTLETFARQSNPIFEKWYQNLFSSRELTKLRDTLLPKLMSGELRVSAAAMLEDA